QSRLDLGRITGLVFLALSSQEPTAQEADVRVPVAGVSDGLDEDQESGGGVRALAATLETELAAEVAELADLTAAKPEGPLAALEELADVRHVAAELAALVALSDEPAEVPAECPQRAERVPAGEAELLAEHLQPLLQGERVDRVRNRDDQVLDREHLEHATRRRLLDLHDLDVIRGDPERRPHLPGQGVEQGLEGDFPEEV